MKSLIFNSRNSCSCALALDVGRYKRAGPTRKSPAVPKTCHVISQNSVSCDPHSNLPRYRMGEGIITDFIAEETGSQNRYVTYLKCVDLGLHKRPIPKLC